MKKIAFSLAVVATIALASCGNKAATEDTTAADTMNVTETEVVATDSDSNGAEAVVAEETTVAPAPEAAKAEEPKTDSAK